MSKSADKAREERHKACGGKRITARVSGEAYEALMSLASHYRMSCGDVLDRLLCGDRLSSWTDPELKEIRKQLSISGERYVR